MNDCTFLDPIWKFVTYIGSKIRLCKYVEHAPFLECCIEHDYDYYNGGTERSRLMIDRKLRDCINNLGYKNWAIICYYAVRFAGYHFFKYKYIQGKRR